MTRQLWKETRALLPIFAAALIVVAAHNRVGLLISPLWGYALAATALGAMTWGQEFSASGMTVLLAQPVSRARIAGVKFAVLAAMLAVLGLVAWRTILNPMVTWSQLVERKLDLLILPLLCALGLAPWLSLAARNALAGLVFALAIPAVLWLATGWLVVATFDIRTTDTAMAADSFRILLVRSLTLATCGIGLVLGWGSFLRFEARDRVGGQLNLPAWPWQSASTRVPRRRPVWQLVGKEMRLQQLALIVAVLYLVGAALTWLFVANDRTKVSLETLTELYVAFTATMCGALAIAEERQMQTLESQLLQPLPMRVQWVTKLAVVAIAATVLTAGLPALVSWRTGRWLDPDTLLVTPMFALLGLYVSSWSSSGLRALLWAAPVAIVGTGTAELLGRNMAQILYWLAGSSIDRAGLFLVEHGESHRAIEGSVFWTVSTAATAMSIAFAGRNHRTAERSVRRVARQLVALVLVFALGRMAMWTMSAGYIAGAQAYYKAHANPRAR